MHILHDLLHIAKALARLGRRLAWRGAVVHVTRGTHVDVKVDLVPHIVIGSTTAQHLRQKRSDSHIKPALARV